MVCGVAGYSAYMAYEEHKKGWMWLMGVITVVFNPIAPIYLTREIWAPIDVIVAAIFFYSIWRRTLS